MMASSSSHDEVFGLPFLFTGGLPNSLEKFSEGNLRCFLIYLIEVVGKANRQNVWQKPLWWRSKLIPYSPIAVDTSKVPQDQVSQELRGLIESCYKYYKAEKILEVSKQLAEIPRILLGIRDNKNNTWTVYDTNSKAVYVTVRPENLHYDLKSLDKVSQDWRSSYTKEDVAFCQIEKAAKTEMEEDAVIVLTDSEEEKTIKRESLRRKCRKSTSPTSDSKQLFSLTACNNKLKTDTGPCDVTKTPSLHSQPQKKSSIRNRGVVIRSGSNFVIAISDSDEETFLSKKNGSRARNSSRLVSEKSELGKSGQAQSSKQYKSERRAKQQSYSENEDEVEFVCEFTPSDRPCPKRFKKQPQRVPESHNVIILSDSEQEIDDDSVYITSYTSLAKNYPQRHFYPETPSKNVQKSILGPLLISPKKVSQAPQVKRVARITLSPLKWPSSTSGRQINVGNANRIGQTEPLSSSSSKRRFDHVSVVRDTSSEDEDVFRPTREELFLRKKKKRRLYNPPSPVPKQAPAEPVAFAIQTQASFMALLGMNEKSSLPVRPKETNEAVVPSSRADFIALIRSMRASFSRMPLDWIRVLSSSNHIILSKRSSRSRQFNPTHINYEAFCSTNKEFVEYNIKAANSRVGKEGRSDSRQSGGRRGMDKKTWTVEKWCVQSEEASLRSKRAALRMLRSLCSGSGYYEHKLDPIETLDMGSLAPRLYRLPLTVFETALQMTVKMTDVL